MSSHIHVFLVPSTELMFQASTGQGSREMQTCYTKKFLEFPTDSFIKIGCSAIIAEITGKFTQERLLQERLLILTPDGLKSKDYVNLKQVTMSPHNLT